MNYIYDNSTGVVRHDLVVVPRETEVPYDKEGKRWVYSTELSRFTSVNDTVGLKYDINTGESFHKTDLSVCPKGFTLVKSPSIGYTFSNKEWEFNPEIAIKHTLSQITEGYEQELGNIKSTSRPGLIDFWSIISYELSKYNKNRKSKTNEPEFLMEMSRNSRLSLPVLVDSLETEMEKLSMELARCLGKYDSLRTTINNLVHNDPKLELKLNKIRWS